MKQTVISLTSHKGGVGKSTLAVNLAGALSLNAKTTLIDEDPIGSCLLWAQRRSALPMTVLSPTTVDTQILSQSRYLLVDTEGRPSLNDVLELTRKSTLVLIPCGTSGLEVDATLSLIRELRRAKTDMENVKVVVTKAPPVGTVGQQARDALASAGVPVARAVIRHYAAHQRAAEFGVLVRDVPDSRAANAWQDVLELAMEVVD